MKNRHEIEKSVVVWYGKRSRAKVHGNSLHVEGHREPEKEDNELTSVTIQQDLIPALISLFMFHESRPEEFIPCPWFFSGYQGSSFLICCLISALYGTRRSYISLDPVLCFPVWIRDTVKFSKDQHLLAFCLTQNTSWIHCYGSSFPHKSYPHPQITTPELIFNCLYCW